MKKVLFSVALCASLFALAGMASAQLASIDSIQTYNAVTGVAAPYPAIGTVVTVEGTLYVVKGQFNTGSHYIIGDDGGIQCYNSAAALGVAGDRIQVTGTIAQFSGELQLSPVSSYTLMSHPGLPTPVTRTISSLAHWPGAAPKVFDYEAVGLYAEVTGTVATAPTNNTPTLDKSFNITAGGDTLIIFVSKNTGIDVGAVAVGDLYRVRGAMVKYNKLVEMKPRSQADLVEGTGPVIANVKSSNYHPTSTTPLSISADITSAIGTIASATLYYRHSSGDSLGAYSSVAMTAGTAPSYSASIPTPHSGIRVDYYISATDNLAQTTLLPASAPVGHAELAVGWTSIYNIQYVDPSAAIQDSPKRGKVANAQGIVTYATGEAGAVSKFVFQDAATPFSGILLYDGTGSYGSVFKGDKVQVGGRIDEFSGMTEFVPFTRPTSVPEGDAAAPVTVVSFGNALPKAQYVRTVVLGDHVTTDGNGFLGEAYEAVRVRTLASLVLPDTAGRRFTITDTGANADTVQVIPFIQLTYHGIPGDHVIVEGFMDDSGKYILRPAADENIISGLTGVGNTTPQLQPAGGFVGVSPNPFNPKTEIRFALTRPNLVQLNVYNIRGELVRTLVNGRLEAGSYPTVWDGKSDSGQTMGSGMYFARLRIGLEVTQVEKLSLVK